MLLKEILVVDLFENNTTLITICYVSDCDKFCQNGCVFRFIIIPLPKEKKRKSLNLGENDLNLKKKKNPCDSIVPFFSFLRNKKGDLRVAIFIPHPIVYLGKSMDTLLN